MLSCTLLCVGRLKEAYWRAACEEYSRRLGGFLKLQIVEVEEESCPPRHPRPRSSKESRLRDGGSWIGPLRERQESPCVSRGYGCHPKSWRRP